MNCDIKLVSYSSTNNVNFVVDCTAQYLALNTAVDCVTKNLPLHINIDSFVR